MVVIIVAMVIVAIKYDHDAYYYRHQHHSGKEVSPYLRLGWMAAWAMSGPVSHFTRAPVVLAALQFPCHLDLSLDPSSIHRLPVSLIIRDQNYFYPRTVASRRGPDWYDHASEGRGQVLFFLLRHSDAWMEASIHSGAASLSRWPKL